jgi:hypothetical protein
MQLTEFPVEGNLRRRRRFARKVSSAAAASYRGVTRVGWVGNDG